MSYYRIAPRGRVGRLARLLFLGAFAPLLLCASSHAEGPEDVDAEVASASQWPRETVELFAALPVQDGGRLKPLDSVAGLSLFQFNGKRSLKLAQGGRIGPMEWLLDCLFYPERARSYACFRIDHGDVLTSMGLQRKRFRDWYSYEELEPGIGRLLELVEESRSVEQKELTPVQGQLRKLAGDLGKFQGLTNMLGPLRRSFSTTGSPRLREIFGEQERPGVAHMLGGMPAMIELWGELEGMDAEERNLESDAVRKLAGELDESLRTGGAGLALFPPPPDAPDGERWWGARDVIDGAVDENIDGSAQIEMLGLLESIEAAKADPLAVSAPLEALHAAVSSAQSEQAHLGLEVRLNRLEPFWRALASFLLAFVLTAFSWLAPRSKALRAGVWGLTLLGLGLAATGITMRCIIQNRPPVVTLFDTITFITSSGVLLCIIMERLTRQKIALGLATVLGSGGMFLAHKYELKEVLSAGDTMASVVAVLDTNYYLAIHVTAITLGYCGGLLSGALGHVWIFADLIGFRRGDKAFYKTLTRMIYGTTCFTLLFAVFGTIMGGVWANDSWGRFWGWDPKENGALLICIWNLLILHMRMGGFIRDRGLAAMTIFGAAIVSASWWGVNLLGVGLHSYGFTSGVATALFTYWGVEAVVLLAAAAKFVSLRRGG